MVSKDKDLRQIINDCTKMYDVQSDEVIDAARHGGEVRLHAQRGGRDADADGGHDRQRAGHPRRGRKTAVKLVKKYGTAEKVLAAPRTS